MKFFVSLLIGLMCVASGAVRAHAMTEGMNAEVLGVYFAPSANVAASIVKVIDASEHEVLVQAYGFTHNGIAQALVRAHQRGVTVRVLLDKKSQSANRYVIDLFAEADIEVREDGKHAIAHDNRNLT
jgi:phosphatidylserine/phosphatidylglycerophosphate/cardiolipin synthase-like enzyme